MNTYMHLHANMHVHVHLTGRVTRAAIRRCSGGDRAVRTTPQTFCAGGDNGAPPDAAIAFTPVPHFLSNA